MQEAVTVFILLDILLFLVVLFSVLYSVNKNTDVLLRLMNTLKDGFLVPPPPPTGADEDLQALGPYIERVDKSEPVWYDNPEPEEADISGLEKRGRLASDNLLGEDK